MSTCELITLQQAMYEAIEPTYGEWRPVLLHTGTTMQQLCEALVDSMPGAGINLQETVQPSNWQEAGCQQGLAEQQDDCNAKQGGSIGQEDVEDKGQRIICHDRVRREAVQDTTCAHGSCKNAQASALLII